MFTISLHGLTATQSSVCDCKFKCDQMQRFGIMNGYALWLLGLGVYVTRVGKVFGFRTGVVLLPAAQVNLNIESSSLNPQILAPKPRCG